MHQQWVLAVYSITDYMHITCLAFNIKYALLPIKFFSARMNLTGTLQPSTYIQHLSDLDLHHFFLHPLLLLFLLSTIYLNIFQITILGSWNWTLNKMDDVKHTILNISIFVIFISHHQHDAISIPNLHITKKKRTYIYICTNVSTCVIFGS